MNVIEFNNVSLWYGEVIALNEVSFKLKPGITGLVGSNGAGKTTVLKLAASLLKPTIGNVTSDGESTWLNYSYLSKLGYSPEIDQLFSFLTGKQFLTWSAKFHGLSKSLINKNVREILKKIGMSHASERQIKGYSRGMRQRIKIGAALISEPSVILADEPLSGTDPIGRKLTVDLLKELVNDDGVTIVVSSHVLHELERITNNIIILESGKLVAEGKINEVRLALSKFPQKLKIRSNNIKQLSQKIADLVKGFKVETANTIVVEVDDRGKFMEELKLIKFEKLDIYEISGIDEDLTSVFKLIKSKTQN